jgi:hypothetical protein
LGDSCAQAFSIQAIPRLLLWAVLQRCEESGVDRRAIPLFQ